MWDFSANCDRICLQEDDGFLLSYGQVEEFGVRLAEAAGGRCLVFILCGNSIGAVAGHIAFIEHGIVPLLLNANIDRELLDNLLALYCPSYLWIPKERPERMIGQVVLEEYGYCLIKTGFGARHDLHDNLGLLLTTSGSTGSPKFVRQSYENIRVNAEQIAEYLELDSSERPVTTLPMNYTYGLSIIHSHLLVGATMLLTDKGLMQREFWDFFKTAEATSFGGVPYTYEMLERLRFRRMELPSLRYMTQAGGKLSPELHKKFAQYAIENNKKFIVMYGQCEATARMGYLPAEDSLRKYGSMGIAIPQGKFTLVDVNGQEITNAGVTGELVYTGPNVTMGYAQTPRELALGDERNGRLETGDMAQRDEEGYYYIVGRKKRFLKVYGNRVNMDELEGLLKCQYGDVDCCCAGTDDHVIIFATQETGKKITGQYEDMADVIKKFISEKTGLNRTAFQVVTVPEIPKNDAGKIQYRELEKYLD
jgi:acyl-coenzyme A synthetase/AMP-(fatty) acid ligase